MRISQLTKSLAKSSSLRKRSQYLVTDIATTIARRDNNDPLVGQIELESRGLQCRPFWEQVHDLEGDCYQEYLLRHPDFSLSVRSRVTDMLIEAQAKLPSDWQLVLQAGFRPYEVQIALLKALAQDTKRAHPTWGEERVLNHARTYVADPTLVCPPHVTGGAVDITVINRETGEPIDMGCPPNTDSEIAFLHSDQLTKQQYDNRMQLLDVMTDVGFAPLATEWWHFQYGETYWAAFYGHMKTAYNLLK